MLYADSRLQSDQARLLLETAFMPVVASAFAAAAAEHQKRRAAEGREASGAADTIEPIEFRLMLVYIRSQVAWAAHGWW